MKIAILGCGTIGSGVYELLKERKDICVKRILDIRKWMDIMTTDINDIVNDSEIETVVETMGGLHPAREFALACLNAGKNYITANKFLVSEFGEELENTARSKGVSFLFGAACGGGIPFLTNLSQLREIDNIIEVGGILNGTTNYILDNIFTNNCEYAEVLAEAQKLGYAERDPSADVDGLDTQRKTVLACAVAYGKLVKPADIPTMGIRNINAIDVEFARNHGGVIRLVARARLDNCGVIDASVQPKICAADSVEASIKKNVNYTYYTCENAGNFSFTGQGAGKLPTASNIIRDAVDAGNGKKGMLPEKIESCAVSCTESRFYLRMTADKQRDIFESCAEKDGFVYGITKLVKLSEIIKDACFAALMD